MRATGVNRRFRPMGGGIFGYLSFAIDLLAVRINFATASAIYLLRTTAMPSNVVPVAMPYQPPPARKAPSDSVMPVWALALILSALTAIASVIVCVGWLVLEVVSRERTAIPARIVLAETGVLTHGLAAPPVKEQPEAPARLARPILHDDAEPQTVAPSGEEETPLAFEHPRRLPMPPVPAVKAIQSDMIQHVEVAKIEVPIEYSVRRLTLPDAPKPLQLAISPVAHDDVAKVINELGEGYRFTQLPKTHLRSVETLKKHDVLFLSCADLFVDDLQAAGPLRKFVEAGGTLYASDLQCELVLRAFPEYRGRALLPGIPQQIDARVVDAGLSAHLGRSLIPLTFDAPDWRPAAFDPNKVTVCLQGIYRNNAGKSVAAPLLVKFRVKSGTVIFTSFHHSKNESAMVRKLVDYLVFASVNARSEARVHDLMTQHGFEAQDMRPVILAPDTPTTATFEHQGGGLQVGLGFESIGARLQLKLRSPNGQTIEHHDEGVFLLDLPSAAAGTWQYTITPLELPHARFGVIMGTGVSKR